ncbi:hypothetical protein KOR42_51520 [Thalassoglobus neptunius]|uniref:DUF4145 domain-containing protein n=1 Tax=Thalassoglobus neptunius TaxID=1938619 RepID=A0A5C5VMG0_9PLAN|nr:hypothetical protein [Thalassoglobus neptunius]TWT39824.1 hypothetical protein KOR42_51520 [Thalassoglobus neptunius]
MLSLIQSYEGALLHPDDEIVYLYEIRDALSKRFGGEKRMIAKLEIDGGGPSDFKWTNFKELANAQPIKQGRHRGNHHGCLRDATQSELSNARNFALHLIRSYLHYLNQQADDQ